MGDRQEAEPGPHHPRAGAAGGAVAVAVLTRRRISAAPRRRRARRRRLAQPAATLGTTGGDAPFDDTSLGNADVSNKVQVVIDWFGPTDFRLLDAQAEAQGCSAEDQTYGHPDSIAAAYLGAPVGSSPELVAEANPITYLDGSEPPFLIQKGDQDCTVAIENTKMLADALSAAGVEVEYDLLAGGGHGDTGGTQVFESEENVKRTLAFLDAHLA